MTTPDPSAEDTPPRLHELGVVFSEFASVSVAVETGGTGARLRLEDLRSGAVRYVDALELESLVWAPDHWWRRLLDPSLHRWREAEPGPGMESLGRNAP